MSATSDDLPITPRARRRWVRGLIRLGVLGAIAVAAYQAASWWYESTGRFVTSDNAYVKAPVIAVSPNIDGRAVEVMVGDNEPVAEGDILFRIDEAPYQVRLRMAEAKRETVRTDLLSTRAELGQIAAEIAEAESRARYYVNEVDRQRRLVARNAGTLAKLDETELDLATAQQRLKSLREKRQVVLAKLGGDPRMPLEEHPLMLEVDAEIERVRLDLSYTTVRSPVAGTVTRMRLQAGEWVMADTPTFGVIGARPLWIEANLKETQLTNLAVGMPVEIRVDAYPDVVWPGSVESLSPATGAEFAALPPQNASGNWVKVVQRLPVRIAIADTEGRPQLRAGMSAVISIDTGHDRKLSDAVDAWVEKAMMRAKAL